MPNIKITDAGTLINGVTIDEETAWVGVEQEVSDNFVKRLTEEFKHVKFDTVNNAGASAAANLPRSGQAQTSGEEDK